MSRGNSVFRSIKAMPRTCNGTPPPGVNDFFLYAMFARVALSNDDNFEFETKYDKSTNTIELVIDDRVLPIFNQITGMKRGPNMQCYINWLIGSRAIRALSQQDPNFVPANTLEVWFGATRSTIGETFVLLPPTDDASVIGHNIKVSDSFTGTMKVHLIWMMVCGANNPNSYFQVRTSASVSSIDGITPTVSVDDTEVSTFNLVEGDMREAQILEVNNITPNNIISLLINRNFVGNSDPKTESIGVVGLRIELIDG
jgi:hypothetical protein